MNVFSARRPLPFTWLMALLSMPTILSILASLLIAPALPSVALSFHKNANEIQRIISLNLAGYAISLLFYGWLIDRFGRRIVLLSGVFLFLGATFFCATAVSFQILLVWRFLQGIFAGSLSLVILVTIRDLFSGKDALRVYAIYGIVTGITPIFGSLIGGVFVNLFGWRAPFMLLCSLSFISFFALLRYFPETKLNKQSLGIAKIFASYFFLIKNRRFIVYVALVCYAWSMLYKFIGVSPFLYEQYHFSVVGISWLMAVVIAMFVFGNLLSKSICKYVAAENILRIGFAIIFFITAVQCVIYEMGAMNSTIFTIISMLVIFFVGFIFSSVTLRALDSGEMSISFAAAFMSFLEWGSSSWLVEKTASATNILSVFITSSFVGLAILLLFYLMIRPWKIQNKEIIQYEKT